MSVNTETASAQGQTTVLEKEGVYASLFEKINLTPASSLGDINAFLDDAALSDAPAGERLWDMECHHNVVQKAVSTRDYNYRQASEDMNTRVDATRGDTTTYGEAYHWADNYLTPGSAYDRNPAPESGAFYARIRHERYLNDQTQTVAFTSCPELSPGMLLKVTGGYEVAEVFAKGVVVTAMHSHAQRDADFCVRFDGIPDSPDFSFRPEPGSRPVMAGTLPARVTSTTENDIYGHIDKDGRYRVNMLFDRENWETGFESLWVRQSRPYAGDTYGLHLPLLAGTEVAIGFEDGNPDRPYIAGVLHDSAHGDHVTIRNYRRNVLRTPANNKIRLDDERGKEHIKVSTEYGGKSQLNLGHLVDSEKQQRGEGFELRTDSWGAIRAQKGIFISADGQAKAQGQVLDMEPALARLSAALVEMESLAACAQQAQALAADVGRQQKLLKQKIEQLHEEVILGSAPKGMALVSGEDMQLSASDNMTLTAGKQLDVGAQNDFTLAAGKQLSLYSREGAKLFSSQNDIDIQAQGGNITTWSTQDTGLAESDLNGWHQGMTQLQQLTNRLNALDEQKGKYMTVSELKSAVFAMSQSFSHTVPLEEQLRLLSILPAGQPLSAAQLNQTEQHLQQLIASYALLKHQKE
ncbi:ImpA domain protein [Enterobacter hormaechei]|nr:type VI secretion system tip protein VgrG [Enterobacter hormaechei]EKK5518920.1 type VI secretion system tip protein VgrG [Enterobacter hormaechei]CQR76630.1 ImpA domain protein [Enterobacter hormaechei]